jgi:hypothetical protein
MKYSYTAGIKTHKRRGEGSIKMSVIWINRPDSRHGLCCTYEETQPRYACHTRWRQRDKTTTRFMLRSYQHSLPRLRTKHSGTRSWLSRPYCGLTTPPTACLRVTVVYKN